YYEGSVWYRKKFDAPKAQKSDRIFVHFGAVNYRADVYLNGKKLGVHLGGFTPFHYEITGKLNAKVNSLILKVDNKRHADGVPTLNTDWWNYGGITRDVDLVVVPHIFIRDYSLALTSLTDKTLAISVLLDGAKGGEQVQLALPELNIKQRVKADADGRANFTFATPAAQLWSPENPQLYKLELTAGNDKLVDKVGLRTITTQGKHVLLNGES